MGRGNAICPDTSSRSHSIAVESQNPGTAYHRYSPPGHQAQYFRDAREFTSHRERIDPGAARAPAPGGLARESCPPLPTSSTPPGSSRTGVARRQRTEPVGLKSLEERKTYLEAFMKAEKISGAVYGPAEAEKVPESRLWSRREVKIRHRGSPGNQNNGLSQLVCPHGPT